LLLAAVPTIAERTRMGVVGAAIVTQLAVLVPLGDGTDTYAITSAALLVVMATASMSKSVPSPLTVPGTGEHVRAQGSSFIGRRDV
jgi:hypothetical protein